MGITDETAAVAVFESQKAYAQQDVSPQVSRYPRELHSA